MDCYPEEFPEDFRVVDLRKGKQIDDGYRAIHLYYQRDSLVYPIEIQLWCGDDYQFNIWSHTLAYKYVDGVIGAELYKKYKSRQINSALEFRTELENLKRNAE